MHIPGPDPEARLCIGVLGPGGVGGFLAAVLTHAGHSVTCIARSSTRTALLAEGLTLDSARFGRFTVRPGAVAVLDHPVNLLFIATKSYDLGEGLRSISPESMAGAVVVPLLNGFSHLDQIRDSLGRRVAVGTISIEARKESTARIVHVSPHARIELASRDIERWKLDHVGAVLNQAGIETRVFDSEDTVIWRKLARLSVIAAATTAYQEPLHDIRTTVRVLLQAAVGETARVAGAFGVSLDPGEILRQIDMLPASLTTSLQRDVAAGRASELESIVGSVVRLGNAIGIDMPAMKGLYDRIRRLN